MRLLAFCLLALAVPKVAPGGIVQGVVLDDESGNPLARTSVNLIPLPGSRSAETSVRAGARGAFTLSNVAPGWYTLRCTRRGFAPAEVGQLRPGRAGMPFEITPAAPSSFFQIRMRRLGAVTGSVLDENNVGIPDWPVLIYTARKPVRRIAQTKTDDRGNFRFGELEAGSYMVRSGPSTLDDDSFLLGTYYKYGTALENAEAVRVRIGETQPDIVIRPTKGRMFVLSGYFIAQGSGSLTGITDTGRGILASSTGNAAPFNVTVPPGPVELLAEGPRCGAWTRLFADRDMQGTRWGCGPIEPLTVTFAMDGPRQSFPVLMRRVDLDGTGPERFAGNAPIIPGYWEFEVQVSPDYYVKSISTPDGKGDNARDGWFGLDVGSSSQIVVTLSSRPATVSGAVTSGGMPAPGAPVYLELFDPELPNPRIRLREARADAQGNYQFAGLEPGRYRVLSSFDFDPEDRLALANAPVLTLREGDTVTQPVELALP